MFVIANSPAAAAAAVDPVEPVEPVQVADLPPTEQVVDQLVEQVAEPEPTFVERFDEAVAAIRERALRHAAQLDTYCYATDDLGRQTREGEEQERLTFTLKNLEYLAWWLVSGPSPSSSSPSKRRNRRKRG